MKSSTPSNKTVTGPAPQPVWESMLNGWNRFWFSTGDPTLLGVIRICTGFIVLYTSVAYTLELQNFHGKRGYLDQDTRLVYIKERPIVAPPFNGDNKTVDYDPVQPVLTSDAQKDYVKAYEKKYGVRPPPPIPTKYGDIHTIDEVKAREIEAFRDRWGVDPRDPFRAYSIGTPEWSMWLHISDPTNMLIVHLVFIGVTLLFTIGFCTRLTSVLTWFAATCYVMRSPVTLFGVDTMMLILLIYLMIGPSGAALSVDALLKRWWRSGGRNSFSKWGWFNLQPSDVDDTRTAPVLPKHSVTANLALRLLQVHVCFVYASAGFAKLKGNAWWSGYAIWGTLANPEFAPMFSPLYLNFLEQLCRNYFLLQLFLFCGTMFTLFFEICYPFLIWNRKTRWLILSMAVVLHGLIGMVMGLKTFAVMMLIMNMAFIPPDTVRWLVDSVKSMFGKARTPKPAAAEKSVEPVTTSSRPSKKDKGLFKQPN